MTGETLAGALGRESVLDMIVEHERDPRWAQFDVRYATWKEVETRLPGW